MKKHVVIIGVILLILATSAFLGKENQGLLIFSNFKGTAVLTTDKGKVKTPVNGEIVFKAYMYEGRLKLKLVRLSLVGESVKTGKGYSGIVSTWFVGERDITLKRSAFVIPLTLNFHYQLMDKILGYRKPEDKECVEFTSYVEKFKATLKGEFSRPLESLKEGDKLELHVKLEAKNESPRLELITEILFDIKTIICLIPVTRVTYRIPIQPVFIRSSPRDPNPTGWAFDEMMSHAKEIWGKCCIEFEVRDPIYVDNADYKVLESEAEAERLMDEVNVPDAIEIFVVDKWDPLYDGGGATWSGGTAAAKVVTCDQQLSVPGMGDVNKNHLAHELGHVLTFKHPGGGANVCPRHLSPPYDYRVYGTPNTVMEPSGFYADNPSTQSMCQCEEAFNPLLNIHIRRGSICEVAPCILRPEIRG